MMSRAERQREEPIQRSRLIYAVEKFMTAVDALATGRGRIKERLYWAFAHISHLRPDENLPQGLRGDFEWIVRKMTRVPEEYKGQGSVKATLRRMRVATAVAVAERILHIYREVERAMFGSR